MYAIVGTIKMLQRKLLTYVAIVSDQSSRPAILLGESYGDGDGVENRTLANMCDWPLDRIEALAER
jgi:hypothetical protein